MCGGIGASVIPLSSAHVPHPPHPRAAIQLGRRTWFAHRRLAEKPRGGHESKLGNGGHGNNNLSPLAYLSFLVIVSIETYIHNCMIFSDC